MDLQGHVRSGSSTVREATNAFLQATHGSLYPGAASLEREAGYLPNGTAPDTQREIQILRLIGFQGRKQLGVEESQLEADGDGC